MAEIMKLTVDTGAITIELVDKKGNEIGTFDFNPSDSNILARYKNVVNYFSSISERIGEAGKAGAEDVTRVSGEIAEQIDYLLGYKVSENFFFERVLDEIAGVIEKVTNQRVEKKLERIRKATAKYSK